MKINKILMYILILSFVFFTNIIFVSADEYTVSTERKMIPIDGDCTSYFTIRSITYNEGNSAFYSGIPAHEAHVFKNESATSSLEHEFFADEQVTLAYYFGVSEYNRLPECTKLTIDVNDSGTHVCSVEIPLYDANGYRVKVALNLDGKVQNSSIRGTFTGSIGQGSASAFDCREYPVDSKEIQIINMESGTVRGKTKDKIENTCTNAAGEQVDCYDTCTTISDIISDYWRYIMIFIPTALIVLMSIDFFKAMSSNNDDALKKASSAAVKRTIVVIIILALPVLLNILFGWFGIRICL